MARRGQRNWDESDIRFRPSKSSRPRTKDRPEHEDAEFGMVVSKTAGAGESCWTAPVFR